MTTTYTPTATWSDDITIPEDGDDADAAAINGSVQDLADNVAFLGQPSQDDTEVYPLAQRAVTRVCGSPMIPPTTTGKVSVPMDGSFIFTACDAAYSLVWEANFPHGAVNRPAFGTMIRVIVEIAPVTHSGDPGDIPAAMPKLYLYRFDDQGGSPWSDYQTDESANITEYNTPHAIALYTALPEAVNRSAYRYVIVVTNEEGDNSLAGLVVQAPSWTVDVLSQDPGAG